MEDGMTQQRYPIEFTGRGGEFFRIWIVNILLTIITLYIYSAWAKIRTRRYFYGNTVLDGSSFEYHAKPGQILLSRMVAAGLFVVVTVAGGFNQVVTLIATGLFFLIIPWAIWRSTKFNMRMTSYRNVRFGFDGSVWPLYLYQFVLPLIVYGLVSAAVAWFIYKEPSIQIILLWAAVILIVNFIITVFTHKRLSSYFLNHYLYGKSRFAGELSTSGFFKTYVLASILALGSLAVLLIPLLISILPEGMSFKELLSSIEELGNGQGDNKAESLLVQFVVQAVVFFYAYLFIVGYFVIALIRVRVRNHVFGQATLDQKVSFESVVPTVGLWWVMFSNLLLIIFTLGLARPFTQVRMANFMASKTTVLSATSLGDYVGEKRQEVGAFGDELGDAFDMDMDVGF